MVSLSPKLLQLRFDEWTARRRRGEKVPEDWQDLEWDITKMIRTVNVECMVLETDSPYMSLPKHSTSHPWQVCTALCMLCQLSSLRCSIVLIILPHLIPKLYIEGSKELCRIVSGFSLIFLPMYTEKLDPNSISYRKGVETFLNKSDMPQI